MTTPDDRGASGEDETTRFVARLLTPGDIIGHFRIVALLGQGGSGAIYEARNIHNEDERVALKILQPDIADRDMFFGLMRAEANALQRVKHDAVIQYRTFGRIPESDEFFLVIEYVEGSTLGAVMRATRLGEGAIRKLALRIIDGLEAAHAQGVIHRDLSPDNVVLPGDDPDRATLIDFGIARNGAFDPLGGSFAGKLSYAAPEQLSGGAMGPWTDLYTLGLVLAAAARGRKLPMGTDIPSAIAAREEVPLLEDVPEGLKAPIAALLEPDPSRRVRSAADAAALFADAPKPAHAPPPPPAALPKTSRGLLFGGAALVVAALALGAWLMLGNTGTPPVVTTPPPAPPVAASSKPVPPETPPVAKPQPPEPPAPEPAADPVIDQRLAKTLEQAKAAAAAAVADAAKADAIAAEAQKAAGQGEAASASATAFAQKARAVAQQACGENPPAGLDCADNQDGSGYAGEKLCAAADCPDGVLGLGTYPNDQHTYEGLWRDGTMTEGCSMLNGQPDYCGQWQAFAITGYGMATATDGGVTAGLFKDGLITGPAEINLANVATVPEATMRGEDISAGEIHGLGIINWKLGDVSSGRWRQGALLASGVVVTRTGLRTEAAYAEGSPVVGRVAYADGRVYIGEFIDDGRSVRRAGLGVLYDAKGRIAQQGRWQDDALVSDFGAP